MVLKVYAVRDVKVEAFLQPEFYVNDAQVRRALADGVENPKSLFYRHPEDFQLFCLGEYDDASGELKPCKPRFICNALEFVKKQSAV